MFFEILSLAPIKIESLLRGRLNLVNVMILGKTSFAPIDDISGDACKVDSVLTARLGPEILTTLVIKVVI